MLRSMVVLQALVVSAAQAATLNPSSIIGTWKYEKPGFVAHGLVFNVFLEGGQCTQIAKATLMGITKWDVNQCEWALDDNRLKVTIIKSSTQPEAVGHSAIFEVQHVEDAELLLASGSEQQKWARTSELPEEFKQALAAAAGAAQQGAPVDAPALRAGVPSPASRAQRH